MLREVLELEGHTVLESVNGVEGIKSYRANPVDLIICDLVMPEKSGITMLRELVHHHVGLYWFFGGYLTAVYRKNWCAMDPSKTICIGRDAHSGTECIGPD